MGSPGPVHILDLGCGTGEITRRLAERYPQATLVGIDILDTNLALARRDSAAFGERIRYEQGDAFALHHDDASFDLVVCRHMSQAVPDFPLVLAEITRVLKPGGWLHLLSEDYGMLHMPVIERDGSPFDPDRFWNANAVAYLRSIGCDGRIGRHSPALLERAGYQGIALDYVIVDTLRVDRATFAGIMRAWRDGYSEVLAEASGRSVEEVDSRFQYDRRFDRNTAVLRGVARPGGFRAEAGPRLTTTAAMFEPRPRPTMENNRPLACGQLSYAGADAPSHATAPRPARRPLAKQAVSR